MLVLRSCLSEHGYHVGITIVNESKANKLRANTVEMSYKSVHSAE